MLCALAAAAHAEWGELGHFPIPVGKGEKQVNFGQSAPILAFATDSVDSSYYIGDEPNPGEFRIQRFVEGKAETSISFIPPESKKVQDGIGETGVGLQLAVDSKTNRVYALVVYKRRNASQAEETKETKEAEQYEKEVEEEKEGKKPSGSRLIQAPHEYFPLDSEEHAAGELFGFELVGGTGKLISAKENGEGKPAPIISESAFADQGEEPKEALLNPRGMAVDPKSGDPVILGVEDEEKNELVEKGAQKQCRAAAQFITIDVKTEKLDGGKLGHRYVDKADALRPGETGCEPEEETEVPLSPVVTPGGNLLTYSGAQSEGQVWEVPTPGSEDVGEEEVATTPTMIYDEHQFGTALNLEPPEEGAGPAMSFASENATEGRIYLSVEGLAHEPIPLALHYTESPDKSSEVTNIGWTAGGAGEMCGIPSPDNVTAVMGAGKESVLVLDAYLEEGGSHGPRVETFAFGPGGSTSGCPKATLTAPHMVFGLAQDATEAPTNQPVSFDSELKGADAKSVKWELKYKDPATDEEGQETVEQTTAQLRNGLGEYEFLPLKYEFKHAGEYEISEIVQGDDLADEAVKAAEVLHAEATATTPILKPAPPKAVRVNEEEATLSVTVEDPNAAEKPTMHLKKIKWEFGDGTSQEVTPPAGLADGSELQIKHTFSSRCKAGKCKVTLTVEDTVAEGTPAKTTFEIAVNESVAEEELHKKEAEAAKQKVEAEEAAAHKKAEEEATAAKKAAEEAAAHKKAEEEAITKKHKEEEEKVHKAPTRAEQLAKALKQCKKESKSKRAKCEATARKKYGPKSKKKRKKK